MRPGRSFRRSSGRVHRRWRTNVDNPGAQGPPVPKPAQYAERASLGTVSTVSAFYVLCPPAPSEWHCDLDALAVALSQRWPGAAVSRSDDRTRAVAWELYPNQQQWLDGSINQDGSACYLRGTPDLIAEFVSWIREREPDPELVLVLDADGIPHPVPRYATLDQVIPLL
jgi:hypothetical protein